MKKIKVFRYLPEIDAFTVTREFGEISEWLGLAEWNRVVWIGRLFLMDNDFGEHWFDNWEEREKIQPKLELLELEQHDVFIVMPDRFMDGRDGPCNTPEVRKVFWTDVLSSMELSHELLFLKARQYNDWARANSDEDYIEDLEERIATVRSNL